MCSGVISRNNSVSVSTGAIAFTSTPLPINSRASDLVKPITPAFAAA